MPRVSSEHLAARRRQIVEAAWRCFTREGFHATSMHDVIAESGLSAGAVYRYFRSKNELILETTAETLRTAEGTLEAIIGADEVVPPAEALERLMRNLLDTAVRDDGVDLTRIGVSAWAEALRDQELHAIASGVYQRIRAGFTEVARRWRDAGNLPPDTDVAAIGQVLFSTATGFLLQRLILGDVEIGRYAGGLAALSGTGIVSGNGHLRPT